MIRDPGAGWSSLAARRAHNPKVAGSNPAPATNSLGLRSEPHRETPFEGFFCGGAAESPVRRERASRATDSCIRRVGDTSNDEGVPAAGRRAAAREGWHEGAGEVAASRIDRSSRGGRSMRERETKLYELIEPTVTALGFELVGVLLRGGRSRGLVRVYIDQEEGVTVDDCARVSDRVNGLLDVADPMPGEYDLEVLVARAGSSAVLRARLRPFHGYRPEGDPAPPGRGAATFRRHARRIR